MNQEFLKAMQEVLSMAHRALTTNIPKDETDFVVNAVKLRLGQVTKEIERVAK